MRKREDKACREKQKDVELKFKRNVKSEEQKNRETEIRNDKRQ